MKWVLMAKIYDDFGIWVEWSAICFNSGNAEWSLVDFKFITEAQNEIYRSCSASIFSRKKENKSRSRRRTRREKNPKQNQINTEPRNQIPPVMQRCTDSFRRFPLPLHECWFVLEEPLLINLLSICRRTDSSTDPIDMALIESFIILAPGRRGTIPPSGGRRANYAGSQLIGSTLKIQKAFDN